MERLRQPELNRYYLELKYILNTHSLHETMMLYVIHYIHIQVPYLQLYLSKVLYRFSSKSRTKLKTFFFIFFVFEFTISVRTCT